MCGVLIRAQDAPLALSLLLARISNVLLRGIAFRFQVAMLHHAVQHGNQTRRIFYHVVYYLQLYVYVYMRCNN